MKKNHIIIIIIVFGLSFILNLFNIRICPFFNLFHIPCPGCGMTRAFILLLQGNIIQSLKYNFLLIPLCIFIIIYLIIIFTNNTKKLNIFINKYKKILIILLTILTIALWITNINNPLLY